MSNEPKDMQRESDKFKVTFTLVKIIIELERVVRK